MVVVQTALLFFMAITKEGVSLFEAASFDSTSIFENRTFNVYGEATIAD